MVSCLFTSFWLTFAKVIFIVISDDKLLMNFVEEIKGYAYSQKGTPMLVDQGGYSYQVIRKIASGRMYWRCGLRKKLHCEAKVVSYENKILSFSGLHCHPPQKHIS